MAPVSEFGRLLANDVLHQTFAVRLADFVEFNRDHKPVVGIFQLDQWIDMRQPVYDELRLEWHCELHGEKNRVVSPP